MASTLAEARAFVDKFNQDYEAKHEAFESQVRVQHSIDCAVEHSLA